MTVESKGRDLFIVDNSVSGWTGLRYLEEWTTIAKAFDIATGYFEIGALLALDGKWQALEKIRILLGAEMTQRTREALLDAVRARAVEILDGSIEADKESNPFLHGAPAILEALRRAYARESQIRETGKAAAFPDRKPPQVAEYSIRKTYGRLLDMFENAFTRKSPLFTLPMYYPLAWYKGPDTNIDPVEQNRQKQVVGLIRTNFLKRFESSVVAFELSCDRLLRKLLAFVEVHTETEGEKRKLEHWKSEAAEILGYATQRHLDLWAEDDEESDDEDIGPQEMLDAVERLDRDEYDVPTMMTETFHDLDQIIHFLDEARKFEPKHDDKLQKLIRLLKSKELAGHKVLIFTEFADTARYLKQQLDEASIEGVAQVDSATKRNRAEVIRCFSPYYNGSSSPALAENGRTEIRVLISTDVLSEGLNLQDASRMMNYDIHWNPVRLMQRIGRVDRRMNPDVETRMVADHPEVASSRGKVSFWNFLPPDELNAILTLYAKVTQKTLLISKTLGIEGKQLLTPKDDFDALKEFDHAYRPRMVQPSPQERYVTCTPLVPLKAAAGAFGDPQHIDDDGFEWAAVETKHHLRPGMFVAQVLGKSMEPAIPDGAWCLFAAPVEGTRQGKTVLVQLRDATDSETGERYTVKRYESEKATSGDSWRHTRITLKPVNSGFEPIVLTGDEGELQIIAELVEVL